MTGQKRKPYIDLEFIYPNETTFKKNYKDILVKLQKDIIAVFKSSYNEKITIDDILILDSSGKVDNGYKMSYHIIVSPIDRTLYYTDSKCSDSSAFHLYTQLINLDPSYQTHLDHNVYNSEPTLRMIGSYKIGSDRVLKPVDNKTFKPIEISVKQKYNYLLSHIQKPRTKLITPIIEQTIVKKEKIISFNSPTKTNISEQIMTYVKKYHPTTKYYGIIHGEKYELQDVLFYSFNYSNREEVCPISGTAHKSNGFYVIETSKGYFMKCHSDKCKNKKAKYLGPADATDMFVKCANQIDQQYLIMKGGIADAPKEPVKDIIINWLSNDKIKTLAVRSPMGTGKTTMIKKILDHYDNIKKILWISHRQTLSKQIYGSFKNHGFVNYMDQKGNLFEHDRLIIQIDSLKRIFKYDKDYNTVFKQYDLVIIDEIEGNMNHFMSPYLRKDSDFSVRQTFQKMLNCIDTAKKLLVLDADLGMRSKLFIDNFGKSIVVNNNYKPIQKIFEITNDLSSFQEILLADIKDGKNVCVVSMSASYLDKLEPKFAGLKYVIHTSKSDDKLKNELENVNYFWKKFQICCFSPTIECGVDFNEKHFDKIYCYLKNGSKTCSQRSLLQMVGRIRQLGNNKILCYYSGPTNIDADIYTYDDILGYFRHYEKINGRKVLENVEYKKFIANGEVTLKRVSANISLFDHIHIYNEVEESNKNHSMFITVLFKLIQRAGHSMIFNTVEEPEEVEPDNNVISHAEILSMINETKYKISDLMKKQSKNQLSRTEKLVLEKYFFMKNFGVKDSSNKDEFVKFHKKYANKEITFKHFKRFFGYDNPNNSIDELKHLDIFVSNKKPPNNNNNNFLDEHNDSKDAVRDKIIVNFLNLILDVKKNGYGPDDLGYTLTQDEHNTAVLTVAEQSMYFANEDKYRPLFNKNKGKFKEINEYNFKHYFKTVKAILQSYGIDYYRGNRKRVNSRREFEYSLSVDKQIRDIVDFKFGLSDTVDEFPNLFHK
ncbi:replication origin binding protein [Acanthamoeba polyphaga mimivirus]|uniref:Replication origin binding protein n=1 Tax=Acanthamoeba polyphaga mimivirus TaxID=212035 RepID=A0A0G2Y6X9_MIMIV|nr:replication origin binding protein [Acanthamoeba polyphaga mimivirus]